MCLHICSAFTKNAFEVVVYNNYLSCAYLYVFSCVQLCKEVDQEQLLNLYCQESETKEAGCLLLSQSFVKEVCPFECVAVVHMYIHVQYRSDARYKARVIYTRLHQETNALCTLRQIHIYTWFNGFIQGDKPFT